MRQIPSTSAIPAEMRSVVDAMKENIEELRGIRSGKIESLPSGASNADIINKINEILVTLQG